MKNLLQKSFMLFLLLFFSVNLYSSETISLNNIDYSLKDQLSKFDVHDPLNYNIQLSLKPKLFDSEEFPFMNRKHNDNAIQKIDTLYQYLLRASGLTCYQFDYEGYTYPLTGTNPLFQFIGSEYSFYSAGGSYFTGILLIYNDVLIQSKPDVIPLILMSANSNGVPDKLINQYAFTSDLIKIDPNKYVTTYLKFKDKQSVSGNFIIYIATLAVDPDGVTSNTIDIFALASNKEGDGKKEYRINTGSYDNDGNLLFGKGLEKYFTSGGDFDLMVFPIIESTGSSVGDEEFEIDGLKFKSISPNPLIDKAILSFNIDYYSYMVIKLIGVDGREIKTLFRNEVNPGENNISIDLSDVPTGDYFYSIITNRTKFAGKLSVAR
jgi:hypothetical protein